ncbi:MAG TPA: low molecular weight phosphatase family protein [Planctomycetota bacterium]|nr:low molecular weight phosphatase family protein [Planctomycetota bacterium]
MKTVLFLCTGNYFRSRFAEHLFNHLAPIDGLAWQAESRGLAPDPASRNVGPISVYTLRALKERNLVIANHRDPLEVTVADFERAKRIIAVKEAEHRPMARERFPAWEQRIEYWHCHDLDCAQADEALDAVERCVRNLLAELKRKQPSGRI